MITRFSTLVLALAVGALLGASACNTGTETSNETSNTKAPADTAKKGDAGSAAANFYGNVPQKAVTAKVGDKVVAFIAEDADSGEMQVAEVTAVNGNTATLKGVIFADTFNDVPGFLIFPLPEQGKAKAGDAVNAYSAALHHRPGRIASVDGEKIQMKVSYTTGKVTEMDARYVVPMVSGVSPLAWVAYEEGEEKHLGVFLGEDGGKAYLVAANLGSGTGKILTVDRAKVSAIDMATPLKAGDEAWIYSNIYGWQKGKVETVKEPGLIYEAKRDEGDTKLETEFFTHVVKSIS